MRRLLTLLPAAVLLAVLLTGSLRRLGPLPPLGPFLDPANGVWAVAAAAAAPPGTERVALPTLTHPVQVVVDDRGVPHIFAATEEDGYRVMGYLVARDRLFQLELQTRAGEGTLTELLGSRLLGGDRQTRALGLPWGAERIFAAMDTSPRSTRAVRAYAEGVNSWIDGLRPRDLPLEYRLLGAWPRRWQPRHSAYLYARMGLTLASEDPATPRLAVQALVGAEAAQALVPLNNPIQEPIQPNGHPGPRYAFVRVPGPGAPDSAAALAVDLRQTMLAAVRPEDRDALGSNNWAVSPARTRDGYALLSGDPHLELTLPSIWYEAHLIVPGQVDVAGVSLPGAPGIVIGFNREVAWSLTNTGGDVMDLYRETVDDTANPVKYRLDGVWRPLVMRTEVYRDPKGRTIATDTVRYSHRGPMTRRQGEWVSLRWTVHEAGRESDLFLRAARSRTASEWLDVMKDYVAPTQNGLVADRRGSIGIRSAGWYPVRPSGGRGDLIFDGSTSASDWTGMLPVEAYPFSLNPAQGFLASNNQQPVDPTVNPAYLGGNWYAPWRALHINQLLRADSQVTPEAMRHYQTDPGSARADAFVPLLLDAAHAVDSAGQGDATLRRAAALLGEWDRRYLPENRRAILFELTMQQAVRLLFDELVRPGSAGDGARPVVFPDGATVLGLFRDPMNAWWDSRRTPDHVEHRDEILAASLRAALDTALARHGDPDGQGWTWGTVRTANIYHLLRLPSLSALKLPVRSGPSTLAPLDESGVHGASWRMVVQLGPEVHAWATYPGGQSGNPASPLYMDRIATWVKGELDPVLFPRTPAEIPAGRIRTTITFVQGK